MSGRPVAANKPEAHRNAAAAKRRCAVPAPGFTLKDKAVGADRLLAKGQEHRQHPRGNRLPAWVRPHRTPSRLTRDKQNAPPHRPDSRAKESSGREVSMASGPSASHRRSRRLRPASIEDGLLTHNQAQQGPSQARAPHGGAPCQEARARPAGIRKFKRARHTCRARRAEAAGRGAGQERKAPAEAGAPTHAVACASTSTSSSTPSASASAPDPACSATATASGCLNITGSHPDPAASRSASLAICAFLSLDSR